MREMQRRNRRPHNKGRVLGVRFLKKEFKLIKFTGDRPEQLTHEMRIIAAKCE